MTRVVDRSFLKKAKNNKNDEFYTQYVDIESELAHYKGHFEGKVVYCNTDDPRVSNFVKFFVDNFESLGLVKLIATGYALGGEKHGSVMVYDGSRRSLEDFEAGKAERLEGDGDFRSSECLEYLRRADVVVTNPPYSLLRHFVSLMTSYEKDFLIVATVNAITYKDIFKLIQDGRVWLGVGLGRAVSGFIVPEHYELYGTEARVNERGERIVSTNNSLWLTTLDLEKRHEDIALVETYADNEDKYPTYDNLDGINVDKTKDIPADYYGLIGVPITFLHKHNPRQFEIVRFRKGDDGKDLRMNGKSPYFRIVVRRKTEREAEPRLPGEAALADGQLLMF
jgi:hypothetical protein